MAAGSEVEVGGQTYLITKMPAMQQFHVSRRIAPIIPKLIPVYVKLAGGLKLSDDLESLAVVIEPFTEALADMPDETAEYLMSTCLAVVKRKTPAGWAPVWSTDAGCMFEDIDLGGLLTLTVHVIKDALGPFIKGMLTSQMAPTSIPAA